MTDYYTGHEGQPVSMQQNEAGAEIRTSQRKYLNFCGKDICQMAAKCHRPSPPTGIDGEGHRFYSR